jgi:hypothetical protein
LIYSPVFVAWSVLDPLPSMRAFDIVVQAHLLAGGLVVASLGWRRGWPEASCVMAATLFRRHENPKQIANIPRPKGEGAGLGHSKN